jgi:hypothetical protein
VQHNARLVCLILVATIGTSGKLNTQVVPQNPSPNSIQSISSAIQKATRVTQLNLISAKSSGKKVIHENDTTPFLSGRVTNRTVWQIEFGDVSFEKGGFRRERTPDKYKNQRTFTVLIDEETGKLLGIRCKFNGPPGEMRPEPSAASAERQLRGGSETYFEVPQEDPQISFLEAVQKVSESGYGNPCFAKEIDGLYVSHSHMGSSPRPVWVVTMRGLPPLMPRGGDDSNPVPEWQLNHSRCVVDAKTGQCLFRTNYPHPD